MNIRSALRTAVEEVRGYWQGPYSLNNPNVPLSAFWNAPRNSSGVSVTEETALRYSAVWSAVTQISQTIGSLPIGLYKNLGRNGREEFVAHPIHRVLQYPNPETSSMIFRETLQAHLLLWGNCYAEIQWNGVGQPQYLWQLHPARVQPFRDDNGILRYRVDGKRVLAAEDMLHIPGLSGDGIVGYSVIGQASQNLGLGIAAEQFGAAFFGNGSTLGGVFAHPGKLGKDVKQGIRESIETSHQGSANAHRFIVLGDDMKYTPIGIPPNQAQFIETRKFGITDVARWFNMPPHMLRDLERATFSNIEHQSIEFGTHTIRPWCVRWEQELERKLVADSERNIQYVHLTMDALLRGDIQSRYTAYGIGRDKGWLSADEIRALEMNPQPDGQGTLYLVQSAQVPVNLLADLTQSQIDKNRTKPEPPQAPRDNGQAEEINSLRDEIAALKQSAAEHRTAVDALLETVRGMHTVPDELRRQVSSHLDTIKTQEQEIATRQALILMLTERSERAEQERDVQSVGRSEAVTRAEAAEAKVTATEAEVVQLREAAVTAQAELDLAVARDESACRRAGVADIARAEAVTRAEAAERKANETAVALTDAEANIETARAALADMASGMALTKDEADAQTKRLEIAFAALQQAEADAEAAKTAADAHKLEAEQARADVTATAQKLAEADQSVSAASAARIMAEAAATSAREATQIAEAEATQARIEAEHARQTAETERNRAAVAIQAAADAEAGRIAADTGLQSALDAVTAQRNASAEREIRMVAAIRELIAKEYGRCVRRETEKARRNHGTPNKLRAWSEGFYLLHEDTCLDALRPAMQAHLAWMGSTADVDTVTRDYIRPQLIRAVQQIHAIADGDPNDYAQNLERVLTKWENERPAALADLILKEEVNHVRSL